MTRTVAIFVGVGVVAAVLLGIGMGFDTGAYVLLGSIVLVAILAVVVARKSQTGAAGPRSCPSCGGLISPNAPYCKHCNEAIEA